MEMKTQKSWFEKVTFHFGICNGWTKDRIPVEQPVFCSLLNMFGTLNLVLDLL